MQSLKQRQRLMLAGLFLSKFSKEGLQRLGFSTFSEAYNAMGYALGGKPASIKNYMQEFDPLFPNGRKGWHGREMRDHCRETYERFGDLSVEEFSGILSPLLLRSTGKPKLPQSLQEIQELDDDSLENESVSKRLITGVAADGSSNRHFQPYPSLPGTALRMSRALDAGLTSAFSPATRAGFSPLKSRDLPAPREKS